MLGQHVCVTLQHDNLSLKRREKFWHSFLLHTLCLNMSCTFSLLRLWVCMCKFVYVETEREPSCKKLYHVPSTHQKTQHVTHTQTPQTSCLLTPPKRKKTQTKQTQTPLFISKLLKLPVSSKYCIKSSKQSGYANNDLLSRGMHL